MATILVIDNYDSFTFNLVQMFKSCDLEVRVFRSDAISVRQAEIIDPDYILISPGPRNPSHAGVSIPLIQAFYKKIPVLGVCLGMQCINEAFGGITKRADVPVHGKTSPVFHNNEGLFRGVPDPVRVARYHSLITEPPKESDEIEVTARTDDGLIMGIRHRKYPLFGVQFHPESFLTEHGDKMVDNFLGLGTDDEITWS